MPTPSKSLIVRARLSVLAVVTAVAASVLVPAGIAVADPAPAATPAPAPTSTSVPTPTPHRAALAMGSFFASSYAAQAAKIDPALAAALHRDLGITPAEYLAEGDAAARAVKVVDSLKSVGVKVLGSSIDGTDLTVNVASAADVATVDATGATAVVGAPEKRDYSEVKFHSVASNNTYGGQGYFYQEAAQIGTGDGFRCSIGFNGYSVATGTPQFVTAGHCATTISGTARLITQTLPYDFGGAPTTTVTNQVLGGTVAGEARYGGNMDYGIVGEGAAGIVPQPSVYTWGGDSVHGPLASTPQSITGAAATVVGANLCKSGSSSGWTCGIVRAIDTPVEVSNQPVNSIIATTCLLPGDSGGGATVGSNAVGIDSGSSYPGTDCNNPNLGDLNNEYESVFFPMVSSAGTNSVLGQQGTRWQLAVPVTSTATVTSPASGASVFPSSIMTGTISGATGNSTALLYLDGSNTPFAKANASTGSWSIPLSGIAVGTHTYSLSAGLGWSPGPAVTGTLVETAVPPTAFNVDSSVGGVGVVNISGWALWPDQPSASVNMAIQVGSSSWTALTANGANSESLVQYPSAGGDHGFSIALPLSPGSYSVCIWAGGSAGGSSSIDCRTVTVTAAPPPPPTQSHIDSITGGVGSLSVAGWAVWPDKLSSAVNMAVQIGNSWTALTANQTNNDSGQPAGAGTSHGFAGTITLAPGNYSVCIFAGNSAGGAASIGCQTVTVFAAPPPPPTQSHIDSVTGGIGNVSVAGWAVWPDKLSTAVNMAVQIGNSWTALTANQTNNDSGQPAGAGTSHGFAGTIALAPGNYSICIWAGNSGGGATSIGCQTVTVLPVPPTQSHIDSITGGVGNVTFAGWAVWPDKLASSVNMAVNIGNSWTGYTANQTNNDSGQPAGAGTSHGFAGTIALAPGNYSVCIFAGNSGGGAASIGCQTVTVLAAPPTQSHIDSITGGIGTVSVAGWAVWPDKLSTAVNMAVQIGNGWTALTADQTNNDSGQPAGAGTSHGFAGTIALAPGNYSVCVWAGSSGGGATTIGCQTVTVLAVPPMRSHIDSVVGHTGYFVATGWAVWPDKPSSSVNMALQLDNSTWIGGTANVSNTDSGQPAGAGTNHGFLFDINAGAGSHTVCIWAGQSVGPAVSIGCTTVVVAFGQPVA